VVRVYSVSRPFRSPFDPDRINAPFRELEENAKTDLARRDVTPGATTFSRSLEMRFRHQTHQVKVPVPNGNLTARDIEQITKRFVALYEQSFGRGTAAIEAGIEILTFQLVATTRNATLMLGKQELGSADASAARSGSRPVYFDGAFFTAPIYEHARLVPGNKVAGPAIIESVNTTMPLHPDQELTVDAFNNLVIRFADTP
jgi:N-methylhydantoinase A